MKTPWYSRRFCFLYVFIFRGDTELNTPLNSSKQEQDASVAPRGSTAGENVKHSAASQQLHFGFGGAGMIILGVAGFIFILSFAQKFLIPLIFSIFIAYTLNPLVCMLQRLRIPRLVATSILMIGIISAIGMHINSFIEELDAILVQLPDVTRKISSEMERDHYGKVTMMEKMQVAASALEKATSQATKSTAEIRKSIDNEQPVFKLREWLLAGSMTLMGFMGQATMVLFLVFFLLVSGDKFKRKLVNSAGSSLKKKKLTVQILSDINTSIQRYMFMLLVTNALIGLLTWAVFTGIGLRNAGTWALANAMLHVIPYFGSLMISGAIGIAAFMQFDSISTALLVTGASLGIATFIGILITTWMTGRIAKMNAAAIFVALLFWGWLWGIWGLLLGVPIIVVVKVVSEHVEGMEIIAGLLGE
jgi:predicted PurR-regulated permease PerM